jgi:hypothetical protein
MPRQAMVSLEGKNEMPTTERDNALAKINLILAKPGGKQAVRYGLSALGSIPFVGGAIAGAGSLAGEREQQAVNEQVYDWAKLADADITDLCGKLAEILVEATVASLALLLGEVLGDAGATSLLSSGKEVCVVLNPSTVEELRPFEQKGWISITSTGATCSMGANNRVGDHIEELKRPYGMGGGFVIKALMDAQKMS